MPEPEPTEPSIEEAESLTQEAFAALEAGHYDLVLELTAQLRALQFSSVFEIEALLYLDQNQPMRALQILDEGTQAVPDLWLLWQLKGNVLSDLKRFDDALESYDRALPLEGADIGSLRLNRATAMWRDGRVKAALREVEANDDNTDEANVHLRWRLEAVRLGLWGELGRCDEVEARAAALFEEQQDLEVESDEAGEISVAFSQIGWALMGCEKTEMAGDWAQSALEVDRSNGQALLLARDTTPDLPVADKTFQVMLEGRWQDNETGEKPLGFFTTLYLVAADAEAAQLQALLFESPRWEHPLKVEECEPIGDCELQPCCIYAVEGYNFYPLGVEDDEDDQ